MTFKGSTQIKVLNEEQIKGMRAACRVSELIRHTLICPAYFYQKFLGPNMQLVPFRLNS